MAGTRERWLGVMVSLFLRRVGEGETCAALDMSKIRRTALGHHPLPPGELHPVGTEETIFRGEATPVILLSHNSVIGGQTTLWDVDPTSGNHPVAGAQHN